MSLPSTGKKIRLAQDQDLFQARPLIPFVEFAQTIGVIPAVLRSYISRHDSLVAYKLYSQVIIQNPYIDLDDYIDKLDCILTTKEVISLLCITHATMRRLSDRLGIKPFSVPGECAKFYLREDIVDLLMDNIY